MTGAEFSEVDFDRLADYVGGALEGTPEETVVARLIAENPAWHEVYAELVAATGTVTAGLQSWGTEPMPADLIARLDTALLTAADTPAAPGSADGGGSAPVRRLVSVPDAGERPSTARKRARRLRWAAPVGVAAAVLAFLGFGLGQLTGSARDDSADSAAAPAFGEIGTLSDQGVPELLASDTNYTAETLAGASPQIMLLPQDQEKRAARTAPVPAPAAGAMAEDALSRLRGIAALSACLQAIAQANGVGEITAQSVDLARYAGAPAAVVRFAAANGSWVWAVGPECGSPGSGSGKLAAVRVG